MPELPALLALLLLPVALLLLMTRNLARRIRHPHDLLGLETRRGAAALLPRLFRLHYDLLFDAALALVVALALLEALPEGGPGREDRAPRALVVDCSRSMFAGVPGGRPIDRALARLKEDRPAEAGSGRWFLAFDAAAGRTRLFPWRKLAGDLEGEALVTRLEGELSLLDLDYSFLAELPGGGRGALLLTDSLRFDPVGFAALELGFEGPRRGMAGAGGAALEGQPQGEGAPAAWPGAAGWDRNAGRYSASFVEGGRRGILTPRIFDKASASWLPLPATGYTVEETAGGRQVVLAGPGTYLFDFADPLGGLGPSLALRIGEAKRSVAAEGPFSKLMQRVFPLLEEGPRPRVVLLDYGSGPLAETRGADVTIMTRLAATEAAENLVCDPALSGGRPLAASPPPGMAGLGPRTPLLGLSWGPAALANPDLPLVYDAVLLASLPPAFATLPPPGEKLVQAAGAALRLAETDKGLLPLLPSIGEFWEPAREGRLVLGPPRHRPTWAGLAALILALKYLVWRRLSGKPLFGRAEGE